MWLTFLTVRKPLSRVTDKLSFVLRAVRNGDNIVVLLCLVVCRCIADSLLCYVGNWRYCGIVVFSGL
jgi:hypothetical protein